MGRKALSPEERKEHEKMWAKKYWDKNKDKINAKRRAVDPETRRKQNRERVVKWQQTHREQYNAYQREWRKKRKEALAKKEKA